MAIPLEVEAWFVRVRHRGDAILIRRRQNFRDTYLKVGAESQVLDLKY